MRPTDPFNLFIGKPKPAVDPMPYLMQLLKAGCEYYVSHGDGLGASTYCRYCDNMLWDENGNPGEHAGACPYWEAIALFGDPNATGQPNGIINAR